jgi:hypothetical protein
MAGIITMVYGIDMHTLDGIITVQLLINLWSNGFQLAPT